MATIPPILEIGLLDLAGSVDQSLRCRRVKGLGHVLVAAFLLVGLLVPTYVRAANYYINASGAMGNGSGSSAANAADASSALKYSNIINAQNSSGTVINYAAGTYYVYPAYSMYSGVTHQGAGIDKTIIKIPNGGASGSFTPLFLASGSTISNFQFFDATIDFNSSNTAWWTSNTEGCSIAFAFSLADHCTIQRVKFINIGTKGEESFPIFFNVGGSASGNMNHNLVDSCIFTQPIASGNTNGGVTCVQMGDALPGITTDNTNVVSNNQFINLNYPTYSDLGYAQCCSCPVAENNTASGVDSLWFVEPGSSGSGAISTFTESNLTVQVTGNTVINSGPVAFVLMHPNGTFGNLNVQNNTVGMTEYPYKYQGFSVPTGVAIDQDWAGNPAVGNITIQSNTFTAPNPEVNSPVAVQANPISPDLFHMASLTVENNILVNFPQDGKQYTVTSNTAYNPNYTNTGNTFDAALSFASAGSAGLTVNSFTAANQTLNATLNFAPSPGTVLTVINNTSANPISGTFLNLPINGIINLTYNGMPYAFTANYSGGDGDDLTLTYAQSTDTPTMPAWALFALGLLLVAAGIRGFPKAIAF